MSALTYWRQQAGRVHQRFYVAFCLLHNSLQDTFLGRRELEGDNFNWSATHSYYGMVNTGRLLSFLALGDFPKSHKNLRLLLDVPTNQQGGISFDWLHWFTHNTGDQWPQQTEQQRGAREAIIAYFVGLGLEGSRQYLDRLGRTFKVAATLRNDSNYEALLIAHEYRHRFVSEQFRRLAELMERAARESASLAGQAFSTFIANDPDLKPQRSAYRALLYDYLSLRVKRGIGRKLTHFPHLLRELESTADVLQPSQPSSDYSEVETAISMRIFSPKTQLMNDFESRINRFEDLIRP